MVALAPPAPRGNVRNFQIDQTQSLLDITGATYTATDSIVYPTTNTIRFSFDTATSGYTGVADSYTLTGDNRIELRNAYIDSQTVFLTDSSTTGGTVEFHNCILGGGTGGVDTIFNGTANGNTITYDTTTSNIVNFFPPGQWVFDPRQRLRRRVQFPHRNARGNADWRNVPANEILALQLLRKMVSQEVFRKYLKYGFVTVQGPSGLTYQIQRKSHIVKVWDQGKVLCTLCVYLKDKTIPPTDEVVAKMIIAECDEADIWKRANVSWYIFEAKTSHPKVLSLGDISRHPRTANAA